MHGRLALALAVAGLVAAALVPRLDAHKPITSPYTFNEDVFPILRDHCTACHVTGGVAPMPLSTAEEAVPWGESIRLELVAGHMPPWAATSNGGRLRHAEGLTARELNVLLTWVTGGAPPGAPETAPGPTRPGLDWPLGVPDRTMVLPEITLAADQGEVTREFVLPLDAGERPLRAVDLLPGTRSIVRSARLSLRVTGPGTDGVERTLAVWVPGDAPVALPAPIAFVPPMGSELVVRVRYKKTWEHERDVMTDRSTIGLYIAPDRAEPLRASTLTMPETPAASMVTATRTFDERTRAVAVYPTDAIAGANVTVDALLPSGVRQRVIGFTPRPGWERRYWFETPFDWPAGTRVDLAVTFPPGLAAPPLPGTALLVLNTAAHR